MFHRMLVAMDGSSTGDEIFEYALAVAQPLQARLMLLHVLSPEEAESPNIPILPSPYYYPGLSDLPLEAYREAWEKIEARGIERLSACTKQAMVKGISAEYTQTSGSVGHTICDLAHNWGADLILIGCRGRAGLSQLILGSVSNYVMHHASCSVLVVKAPTSEVSLSSDTHETTTHLTPSQLAGWQ
jgi:nucleotide-binding universal stress UspA family protein